MLKWAKRIGLSIIALLLAIPIIGVPYEQWSRLSAARSYLPPGELIEFQGRNSHLYCLGEGSPIVVLESGGLAASPDWILVQESVAVFTRVCSYDRAGTFWSDKRSASRDANQIASELHALLEAAAEPAPYIVVGHSIGGLYAMVFSQRFDKDVVGIILVDPTTPDVLDHAPEAVSPVPLPPMIVTMNNIMAEIGLTRLALRSRFEGAPEYVQRINPSLLPQSSGYIRELQELGQSLEQAREGDHFGDKPLIILTATNHASPGLNEDVLNRIEEVIPQLHANLATLSSNSDHRIIDGSSHNIHWDDPGVVVTAIRDVLEAIREGTSL